jgi:hypothetical protein
MKSSGKSKVVSPLRSENKSKKREVKTLKKTGIGFSDWLQEPSNIMNRLFHAKNWIVEVGGKLKIRQKGEAAFFCFL